MIIDRNKQQYDQVIPKFLKLGKIWLGHGLRVQKGIKITFSKEVWQFWQSSYLKLRAISFDFNNFNHMIITMHQM